MMKSYSPKLVSNLANVLVHPCIINGQATLVYDRNLPAKNRLAFEMLDDYAQKYGFKLVEDRRKDFLAGVARVADPLRSTLIPLLFLAGFLISSVLPAHEVTEENIGDLEQDQQVQVLDELQLDSGAAVQEEDLMQSLINWISARSGFECARVMPELVRSSNSDLLEMAFDGNTPVAAREQGMQIFGLYNYKTETVYLRDDIDLQTEQGRGILLHELVHYLQHQNDVTSDFAAREELESLAYMLEAKYLFEADSMISLDRADISS